MLMYLHVPHPVMPRPRQWAQRFGWALKVSKRSVPRELPPSRAPGVSVTPLQKVMWVLFFQKAFFELYMVVCSS